MLSSQFSELLPDRDPAIEALDPTTRKTLGEVWQQRATAELSAGWAFAVVVTELYEVRAEPFVLSLATRGAHDEVQHAALCAHLAGVYLGHSVPMALGDRAALPHHDGADERLRMQLHVVGLTVSEALASGFLQACLAGCQAELPARVVRTQLEDAIRHARVGWAHMSSAAFTPYRDAARPWMPRLIEANLRHWRRQALLLPVEPAHGYPSHGTLLKALDTTAREVLLPGLALVGLH